MNRFNSESVFKGIDQHLLSGGVMWTFLWVDLDRDAS
jgi:hypothetical protein